MAKIDLSLPKNKRYKKGPRVGSVGPTVEPLSVNVSSQAVEETAPEKSIEAVDTPLVESDKSASEEKVEKSLEIEVESDISNLETKDLEESKTDLPKIKLATSRSKRSK